MAETRSSPLYPLGNSPGELDRLARQSHVLERATERTLRDAGIASGQRVLDIGCGPGDLSLLVTRIVGSTGAVVGIERSAEALSRARDRIRRAQLSNVDFVQSDVADFSVDGLYDAAVGRYILMFVPDAVSVLRHVRKCVRPGGAIAFMETSWNALFALSPELALWRAAVSLLHDNLVRSGSEPEMGLHLYRVFQSAGLPPPQIEMTVVLGVDESARWLCDAVRSNVLQTRELGTSFDSLGAIDTLEARLCQELTNANVVAPIVPLVSAWCTNSYGTSKRDVSS